jgi:DNA repair exonuclease SbcCD ATPase subunit
VTEVAKAEQTLASLEDKRKDLANRAIELDAERQKISFAAHTGDNKARKRLDEINTASANHTSEMQSIDAAIAEANQRLEAAKREAAIVDDRAKAEQLKILIDELGELGTEIDAAFGDAIAHLASLKSVLDKIHALGVPNPSHDQLRVFSTLAMRTVLMQMPYPREFEIVPPSQRRTFQQMVSGWQVMLLQNIAARLETEAA